MIIDEENIQTHQKEEKDIMKAKHIDLPENEANVLFQPNPADMGQ